MACGNGIQCVFASKMQIRNETDDGSNGRNKSVAGDKATQLMIIMNCHLCQHQTGLIIYQLDASSQCNVMNVNV